MSMQAQRDEPDERAESSDLVARVAMLEAENERLRTEYIRARRSRYRRTALGLILVGGLAAAGGVLIPDAQTLLFAFGATGIFAGLLTYYLTPERFIAASVGEEVYRSLAANGDAIVTQLGLEETRVYIPPDESDTQTDRLFVPQHTNYELPTGADLESVFVVDGDRTRGIALKPTGSDLYAEFARRLADEPSSTPELLGDQLVDGLTEQFELVRGATVEAEAGRLSVGITDSAYGAVDGFDHPIASFLGVGVARGLGSPVTVDVRRSADDRSDYVVTCLWEPVDETETRSA